MQRRMREMKEAAERHASAQLQKKKARQQKEMEAAIQAEQVLPEAVHHTICTRTCAYAYAASGSSNTKRKSPSSVSTRSRSRQTVRHCTINEHASS